MSNFPTAPYSESKRLRGQFFTTTNPFNTDPFHKWLKAIPAYNELVFVEPFAGANNIVTMIKDLGYMNAWACFDVQPADSEENASGVAIEQRDTLASFPAGFEVAITNPPYLAKNSATKRGLPFPASKHDDIYKIALDVMLRETPYVAAIIPESFITQELFHERLHAVISLTCKMFEDTEVPVCLALFVPTQSKPEPSDFLIYSDSRLIGSYASLKKHLGQFKGDGAPWRFNDPYGLIGLHAVDGNKGPSIRFVPGEEILPCDVKSTGRSVTRVGLDIPAEAALKVVEEANRLLTERRQQTKDAFMTAFKGLRQDGRYRRRLDFTQAREILNIAAKNVGAL